MPKDKFFNYGTEDYTNKRVESVTLKAFKASEITYYELCFNTANSVQTINLTQEQKNKLKEIL